jgi:hypothetical protein
MRSLAMGPYGSGTWLAPLPSPRTADSRQCGPRRVSWWIQIDYYYDVQSLIFQGNHSVFRSGPPSAFETQTLVRARTRTERRLNAACCIGWHIPTVMPVELIFLGPAGPSMHGYRKEALPRADAGSVDRVCVGQSDSPCAPPPRDETSSADCGWPTFTTKRRAWCIERSSPTECVCGTTGH